MSRLASDTGTAERARVALVGVGAVTGYGWGYKFLQQGLLSGRSAVGPASGFSSHFPSDHLWVSRVPDDVPDPVRDEQVRAPALRFAVHEAIDDAHDRGWRPGPNVGVVHCLVPDSSGQHSSLLVSEVVREYGFHGPVVGVSAMTASTIAGLLTAKSWIDSGVADDVLVVNSDLDTSPERCAVLARAGLLAADGPALDRCRPFQQGSAGFAPGEAVVAIVVSATTPGAYGLVLGGAMGYDELHPKPSGLRTAHVERAVLEALANAGVPAGDVTYLNAHGAGIPASDTVEASVYDETLGGAIGMFSVKPLVGHCQSAAGAVELCASLYGFATGVIPAPPRVARGHPRLLDGPTAVTDGLVLKASLGMSGHNAVVVLAPPER